MHEAKGNSDPLFQCSALYKALHDMDHFLLRYGPKDVGPYVSDATTVTKYYGMLSVYADP